MNLEGVLYIGDADPGQLMKLKISAESKNVGEILMVEQILDSGAKTGWAKIHMKIDEKYKDYIVKLLLCKEAKVLEE